MHKTISLRDALCGAELEVASLDGRRLRVAGRPGEITKPGAVYCVPDEGMPFPGRPYVKGNLYIIFEVGLYRVFLRQPGEGAEA